MRDATGIASTRRAASVGAVVLLLALVSYPFVASFTGRPLAVFALPALLTAVMGSWQVTAAVGACSLGVAVAIGVAGPLEGPELTARLLIIVAAIAAAAVGAWRRDVQAARIIQLDESSSVLRDFERSFVPLQPATVDGAAAIRLVASNRHLDVGGDFVDVVTLPDGQLGIVIGDVCGHGPTEAALGTAMRSAWRTVALTQPPDPVAWLELLHQAQVPLSGADTYVTLCTGVVNTDAGSAVLVSAGHPWPIIVTDHATMIAMPPGPPIGLGQGWQPHVISDACGVMLLYTDGLIENPATDAHPRRWGETGLLNWLDEHGTQLDPQQLADQLLDAACDQRELRDDIAIITFQLGAARRHQSPVP